MRGPSLPQATVKRYDSVSQTGVLVSDDGGTEWAIDAEALDGSMFRFLRPGQRVTFDLVESAGGAAPRNLRIGIS
jgi:cold shock CspA family protein